MPTTRDLAHNPGMCPGWESNQRPFGLQAGAQSTEPHQPWLKSVFLRRCKIPELGSDKTETRIQLFCLHSTVLALSWEQLAKFNRNGCVVLFLMDSNSDRISCFLGFMHFSFIFAIKTSYAYFLFYLKERVQDDSLFWCFLVPILLSSTLLLKGKKAGGEWERCQVIKLLIHVFVRLCDYLVLHLAVRGDSLLKYHRKSQLMPYCSLLYF